MIKFVRHIGTEEPFEQYYIPFAKPFPIIHMGEGQDRETFALGYATCLDDEIPGVEYLLESGYWAAPEDCCLAETHLHER